MTGAELLALLAPPLELINSLEQLFAVREREGRPVSPQTLAWLVLWRDIRGDGKTAIDGVSKEVWAKVGEIVVDTGKELAF